MRVHNNLPTRQKI